jgi:hypothetical protein
MLTALANQAPETDPESMQPCSYGIYLSRSEIGVFHAGRDDPAKEITSIELFRTGEFVQAGDRL